jgi:hypothetical protein
VTTPAHFFLRGRFSILVRGAAFRLSEEETRHRIQRFLFMFFSTNPKSKIT